MERPSSTQTTLLPQDKVIENPIHENQLFTVVLPTLNITGCLYMTEINTGNSQCYSANQFSKGEHMGLGITIPIDQEQGYRLSHDLLTSEFAISPLIIVMPLSEKYKLRRYYLLSLLLSGIALGVLLYNSLIMIQSRHWWKLRSSLLGLSLLMYSLLSYRLLPISPSLTHLLSSYVIILLIIPLFSLSLNLLHRFLQRSTAILCATLLLILLCAGYFLPVSYYSGVVYFMLALVSGINGYCSKSKLSTLAWSALAFTILMKTLAVFILPIPTIILTLDSLVILGIIFLALTQINITDSFYQKEKSKREQYKQQISLISVVSHELRNSAQIIASLVERNSESRYMNETEELIQLLENVLDTVFFQNPNNPISKKQLQLNQLTGWNTLTKFEGFNCHWDKYFTPSFSIYDRVFNRWLLVLCQRLNQNSQIYVSINNLVLEIQCHNQQQELWKDSTDLDLLLQLNESLIQLLQLKVQTDNQTARYQIPLLNLAWNIVPQKKSLTRQRVLVAEDEDITQDMLKVWLEHSGHEVIQCTDGGQVINMIDKYQPDLLLLDNQLPNKTGIEILEKLNNRSTKKPKVILISADLPETLPKEIKVLQKPLNRNLLLSTIEYTVVASGQNGQGQPPLQGLDQVQKRAILTKLMPAMKEDSQLILQQLDNQQYTDAANTLHKLMGRLSMIGLDQFSPPLKSLEDELRGAENLNQSNTQSLARLPALLKEILFACEQLKLESEF